MLLPRGSWERLERAAVSRQYKVKLVSSVLLLEPAVPALRGNIMGLQFGDRLSANGAESQGQSAPLSLTALRPLRDAAAQNPPVLP